MQSKMRIRAKSCLYEITGARARATYFWFEENDWAFHGTFSLNWPRKSPLVQAHEKDLLAYPLTFVQL